MMLDGRCHCGAITFTLEWPGPITGIVARECACSFCVKHAGAWTSHPDARLRVTLHQPAAVAKYAFGSGTATFYVCSHCGVVPFVASDIDTHRYAVVNVNTFDSVDPSSLHRETARFDLEAPQERLARRQRHWIADVDIAAGSG
jgi:hypothetical protein